MICRKLIVISLALARFAAPGISSASWFADPEAGVPAVEAISELQFGPAPARHEILVDIAEFNRNLVSADGLCRYRGGDDSWDFIGAAYEWRYGSFVRTDRL